MLLLLFLEHCSHTDRRNVKKRQADCEHVLYELA